MFPKKSFNLLFILNLIATYYSNALANEWINIYIHGTYPDQKIFANYSKALFFGDIGLHHINKLKDKSLFFNDATNLCLSDPTRFNIDHFYTFAWTGALSFFARKKAGIQLYKDLKQLILEYKNQYHISPKIRIITFSHGGNVGLNMVRLLPFLKDEHIQLELLIIACPVQKPLGSFIKHPEIDFILNISSENDWVQLANIYTYLGKINLPTRLFDTTYKKCCQLNITINNKGLGHLDMLRSFFVHIPYCLDYANTFFNPNNSSNTLNIAIDDDKFIFYNGLNLIATLNGERKS